MLVATAAAAVDVTTCGQVIPPGETGVLLADLDCSGLPSGSDGIVLQRRSSLDLQGHTLIGPPPGDRAAAVGCRFGEIRCREGRFGLDCRGPAGRCRVFSSAGTGQITGSGAGIDSDHDLLLENLAISSSASGAFAYPTGKLVATNVSVTGAIGSGLSGLKMRLSNVASNDNAAFGILLHLGVRFGDVRGSDVTVNGNGLTGIFGGTVRITRLSATGNGFTSPNVLGGGVWGKIRLVDSVVTGNVANGVPMDLLSGGRPRLVNTVCGHSVDIGSAENPLPSWGVCTGD